MIAASAAAAAEAVVSYILSFGADEFRMNVNEIFREANASECATEKLDKNRQLKNTSKRHCESLNSVYTTTQRIKIFADCHRLQLRHQNDDIQY